MTIDEIKELYKMIAERDDSIGDLISKIAEKDARIAELEKDREDARTMYDDYNKRIAELEATVEKMKCCGNCKAFHHCQFRLSDVDVIVKPPENFDCNKWEAK